MYNVDATLQNIFHQPADTIDYLCSWSKKFRYIYIETPKAGCTTIKATLQLAESDGEISWNNPSDIHDRSKSPLLAPKDDIEGFEEALRGDQYFRFCFVRNPISRIVSCWLEKFVNNESERFRLAPLLGLNPEGNISFITFLHAILERPDEYCDPHWAAQTYLLQPRRVNYSYIGRFETFAIHLSAICRYLKIPKFHDQKNLGMHHATRSRNASKAVVTREALEMIHRYYERDFVNFGYGWSPDLSSPLSRR